MSAEPTITCPSCQTEIKLTESLAGPLLAATREEYEARLREQGTAFAKRAKEIDSREKALAEERKALDTTISAKVKDERDRLAAAAAQHEKALKERQAALEKEKSALDKQKESLDASVAEKLAAERSKIAEQEAKKARLAVGEDIDQKTREIAELGEVLKQRDAKLAKAQEAQAELVRKQRELDDARREMPLTIEKAVSERLSKERQKAEKAAEEKHALKIIEQQTTIDSMKKKIEELNRKAEQGSQQLQGEALELQLEALLSQAFPHDQINPVPKGEHGGDVLHCVHTPAGIACGTILWESKRTKNWSDSWLPKLREDQRQAKADIAIIISIALPQAVETFDQIDGVWIAHPRYLLPVAACLRQMLHEVSTARQTSQGVATKSEMMYQYFTGPRFRLRVEAIVESFSTMNDDLLKEKKAIQRQWAKREMQINRVMQATVGMVGDLQGIAGQSLKEIEGLTLDDDDDDDDTPRQLEAN